MKAEPFGTLCRKLLPVGERGFQQNMGPLDIGRDERRGTVDRAVDMRFCGQVKHRIGIEFSENVGNRLAVADVGPAKGITRIALYWAQ